MFFVAAAFVGAILAGLFASDVMAGQDDESQQQLQSRREEDLRELQRGAERSPAPAAGRAGALAAADGLGAGPEKVATPAFGRQVLTEYPRPPYFGKAGPTAEEEPWRPVWPRWLTLSVFGRKQD